MGATRAVRPEGSDMESKASKSPHTLFWIAGIAVTVFSAVGIAAIMGWIPTSTSSAGLAKQPTASARPAARAYSPPARVAAACPECGVVESVREFETKGEGSGIGAVGGAVVGGVIGHQIGDGRGQDIATVVGAVGGAVAGHQIEKHVKSTKRYEITVRFEDGSSRVIHEASVPAWRNGDQVKVINGVIQSNA